MSFCTVINCMDGRVQVQVNAFMKKRFGVEYVDTITEAGPVQLLDDDSDTEAVLSVLRRVDVSVNVHESKGLAVAAHHDCAGNPVSEETQKEQLNQWIQFLVKQYPDLPVIGIWIDRDWKVHEIDI